MKTLTYIAALVLLFVGCSEDPVPSGPSYQYSGTPFADVPAIEDIVLYEVNMRAFSASGDLQGVISRLNNIEELGVNVIWLMPIYPVGEVNTVNSPYCVKDYQSVASEYGDLEDLKELTTKAHAKGIAVILDWVANHTAWDHPWVSSHPDWYTQDGSGNIVHPPGTNWQDVADLNYDNSSMRASMIESMKYWVENANVDGFRCDYADGVPFDFWVAALDSLRALPNRDFIFFAEGNRNDHFAAGFDLSFGWSYYGALLNVFNGGPATNLQSAHNAEFNNTPTGKSWVRFTTNHDQSAWDGSPVDLFHGIKGATAASVINAFSGGVPLIYGGQEVGTPDPVPFFYNSTTNWYANSTMRTAYEKVHSFYASTDVARYGGLSVHSTADVFCITRNLGNQELLVMVNVRNNDQTFVLPTSLQNTNWTGLSGQSVSLTTEVDLSEYGYRVLMR